MGTCQNRPLNALALPLLAVWLWTGCTEVDRIETLEPVRMVPSALMVQQAQAGDAAAQFALADAHRGGADPAVMLHWLRESAQQNHAPAVVSMGVLALNGDNVPLDRAEAYRWFNRAAILGDDEADQIRIKLSAVLTEAEWQRVAGLQ
jgi:TPR repeat protein